MVRVIKNTLVELKKNDLIATPDNYFKEFKKQADRLSIDINECIIFDSIISKLSYAEQQEIKKNKIETFSQLSNFLIHKFDHLKGFAFIMHEVLSPSICTETEESVNKLTTSIAENPNHLLDRKTISKIKEITKQRISNDRKVIRNKAQDLTKLSGLMGKYFDRTLLESGNSASEILTIKDELETLSISPDSYREVGVLQSKLVNTIYDIEHSLAKNQNLLKENQSSFKKMNDTIKKLQHELENAKDETNTDYLTKILNRRAFDSELEKIEKKYTMFGTNYAVVFYDIDKFKDINDIHGHDAGDAILRTFAAVLNALTRQEDILARYGGEEFVVLLNYDNEKELTDYLKRVKNIIQERDFNYKDTLIDIKFSAGLSRRNQHTNSSDTLNRADELLYKAKNEGRNRIILDNGIQILE